MWTIVTVRECAPPRLWFRAPHAPALRAPPLLPGACFARALLLSLPHLHVGHNIKVPGANPSNGCARLVVAPQPFMDPTSPVQDYFADRKYALILPGRRGQCVPPCPCRQRGARAPSAPRSQGGGGGGGGRGGSVRHVHRGPCAVLQQPTPRLPGVLAYTIARGRQSASTRVSCRCLTHLCFANGRDRGRRHHPGRHVVRVVGDGGKGQKEVKLSAQMPPFSGDIPLRFTYQHAMRATPHTL